MAFIFSERPQKSSLGSLCDLWLAGIIIRAHWITVNYQMGTFLDHVKDPMVICGPVEAFFKPVPVLVTLLGAF